MDSFQSWLGSQSGASVIVAFIALIGVLWSTHINNERADQRRRADQEAADIRRRDDQEAEDKRRADEVTRNEFERKSQKLQEERDRQRLAVARFVGEVKNAAARVAETPTDILLSSTNRPDLITLNKVAKLAQFSAYVDLQVNILDLEITQPHVRECLCAFSDQLRDYYLPFYNVDERGGRELIEIAREMAPLNQRCLLALGMLVQTARGALLESPERWARKPVEPLTVEDLENF